MVIQYDSGSIQPVGGKAAFFGASRGDDADEAPIAAKKNAKLREPPSASRRLANGRSVWMAVDFDEPLDDFPELRVMDAIPLARLGSNSAEYLVQRIW
jgi:hypothetical protein